MSKQSKWIVIATEGATTDGREIQRKWIEEMAESYDPQNTYGARINLDHIKFNIYWPDMANSQCFGDVLALKAEEREDGKLQLFAQIKPTNALIELNRAGQKVYTSVEIDTNFADTGKAYLVGLAVTDNPASLGTEMLSFSHNGLNNRKLKAENLFTAAIETSLEFEEISEKPTFSVFEKIKALFAKKEGNDQQRFADYQQALELLAEQTKETQEKLTALETELQQSKAKLSEVENQNQHITAQFSELERKPIATYSQRPRIAGEKTHEYLTDC